MGGVTVESPVLERFPLPQQSPAEALLEGDSDTWVQCVEWAQEGKIEKPHPRGDATDSLRKHS